MEDVELLRAYAEDQSERAFAELVERHVDMVFSTAVRMVSDGDLARDVVQVVFTDLARHARDHRRITVVSGWLYRRTCFAALDLLRSNVSRRAREKVAMELYEVNDSDPALWQRLRRTWRRPWAG
jgi:DNA-directed RNA polymerase specialized sigma24 family protein